MSQLIDAKRNEGNARVVTMVRAGFSREALLEAVEETDKVCARMAEDERLYAERERAEALTEQLKLLDNIIEKWRIEIDDY
jgi:hypothetical protein